MNLNHETKLILLKKFYEQGKIEISSKAIQKSV